MKNKILPLTIIDYSDELQGIAKVDNKIINIDGSIVGEEFLVKKIRTRKSIKEAVIKEIHKVSTDRVTAKCKFFGICGGCSLQHLTQDKQLELKLHILKRLFARENIVIKRWIKPIKTGSWGYRRKARLGAKFVIKKDKVLVGFREKYSSLLTDMDSCQVLHPQIGTNIKTLANMITKLSIKNKVAQLEVAISEQDTAIIIRNLAPLTNNDLTILLSYQQKLNVKFFTQSGGTETLKAVNTPADLVYSNSDFNLKFRFGAHDFTQINFAVNQKMVKTAVSWLNLCTNDCVIDLFCGIGNFSLPIATKARRVIAIDCDDKLIQQAKLNAKANNINNITFYAANLFAKTTDKIWLNTKYDKVLLDPARNGAKPIIPLLVQAKIKKIVYISCNPKTLAADSLLLYNLGYQLTKAAIVDMFTHTKHIETMILFDRV